MTRGTPLRVAFRRPWPGTVRGQLLWLIAIVFGLKGGGYLFNDTSDSTESALRLFTEGAVLPFVGRVSVPLEVCGAVIVAVCVFAALSAYCHYGNDRYGYMALVGFALAWGGAFAVSPLLLDGPSSAMQGALTYGLIALVLLRLAGVQEAPAACPHCGLGR